MPLTQKNVSQSPTANGTFTIASPSVSTPTNPQEPKRVANKAVPRDKAIKCDIKWISTNHIQDIYLE